MLSDLKTGTEVGADTQQTCLEVGCGSGAVSLSLLKSLPQVRNVYVAFVGLFLLYVWGFMIRIFSEFVVKQFPAPRKLSGQTDLKYAVVHFHIAPFSSLTFGGFP